MIHGRIFAALAAWVLATQAFAAEDTAWTSQLHGHGTKFFLLGPDA